MGHDLLGRWRLMHIGAQPVAQSMIPRWLKLFPHHQYDTNYGLSESIGPGRDPLGAANADKSGATGQPGSQWPARIGDDKGHDGPQREHGHRHVTGAGVQLHPS